MGARPEWPNGKGWQMRLSIFEDFISGEQGRRKKALAMAFQWTDGKPGLSPNSTPFAQIDPRRVSVRNNDTVNNRLTVLSITSDCDARLLTRQHSTHSCRTVSSDKSLGRTHCWRRPRALSPSLRSASPSIFREGVAGIAVQPAFARFGRRDDRMLRRARACWDAGCANSRSNGSHNS